MRILRIEVDRTVLEKDEDEIDWMDGDGDWDAISIDKRHDAWVDDQAMFSRFTTFCMIGGQRIPLPAIIAGADGERTVDATMTVEELEALIG